MNKKRVLIVIVVIIILFLLVVFMFFKHDYKTYRLSGEKCVTYTKDCTCFGILVVMDSIPEQYSCGGYNFCKKINILECW